MFFLSPTHLVSNIHHQHRCNPDSWVGSEKLNETQINFHQDIGFDFYITIKESHRCWWWMLETVRVGDKFPISSLIGHYHKVTKTALSPTLFSLSFWWFLNRILRMKIIDVVFPISIKLFSNLKYNLSGFTIKSLQRGSVWPKSLKSYICIIVKYYSQLQKRLLNRKIVV